MKDYISNAATSLLGSTIEQKNKDSNDKKTMYFMNQKEIILTMLDSNFTDIKSNTPIFLDASLQENEKMLKFFDTNNWDFFSIPANRQCIIYFLRIQNDTNNKNKTYGVINYEAKYTNNSNVKKYILIDKRYISNFEVKLKQINIPNQTTSFSYYMMIFFTGLIIILGILFYRRNKMNSQYGQHTRKTLQTQKSQSFNKRNQTNKHQQQQTKQALLLNSNQMNKNDPYPFIQQTKQHTQLQKKKNSNNSIYSGILRPTKNSPKNINQRRGQLYDHPLFRRKQLQNNY